MTATKAYFGFPRWTDQFAFVGGAWLATFPASNLGVLPLTRVARSIDATAGNTGFFATVDTGNAIPASGVALIGHNAGQGATVRLRCWSDAAGTALVFDSGTENLWPAGYTAFELASGVIWTWNRRIVAAGVPPLTVGSFQVDITDTSNPYGYIQAGACEIYQAFDVTYNFPFGTQWGVEWRSQGTEAPGGAEYFERRNHPRLFKGNFEFTTLADAMVFYEMWQQLKYDQPVFFSPTPDDVTNFNRLQMFARQMDPGLASYRARTSTGLIHSVPVALREITA